MKHLYFAYGSNLSREQMKERCPNFQGDVYDIGYVKDKKLCFPRYSENWGGGVASIEDCPGTNVWGAIYEVTDEDRQKLDGREGCAPGRYRRVDGVKIETLQHQALNCFLYVAIPDRAAPPAKKYVDRILDGMNELIKHGMPIDHVQHLTEYLNGLAEKNK